MTTPIEREDLAQRVLDALLGNNPYVTDSISEALSTVTGLADLLAQHGDMTAFYGHSVAPDQIRGAASAILYQVKLISALVEHLGAENRRLLRALEGTGPTGEVAP